MMMMMMIIIMIMIIIVVIICAKFGRRNKIREVPAKYFKQQERGLTFQTRFGSFFRSFFSFFKQFSYRVEHFRGQFHSADVPP